MKRLFHFPFLCVLLALGAQSALAVRCELALRRLNTIVESSKIVCLGTSSPVHLNPGVWDDVEGSYSLPNMLLARRSAPGAVGVFLFAAGDSSKQAMLLLGATGAALAGLVLGGWFIPFRRWRLCSPHGERLFNGVEAAALWALQRRSAGAVAMLIPAVAVVEWLCFADKSVGSEAYLAPLRLGTGSTIFSAASLFLLATAAALIAARDWKAREHIQGRRCSCCGYRIAPEGRCPECGSVAPRLPLQAGRMAATSALVAVAFVMVALAVDVPRLAHALLRHRTSDPLDIMVYFRPGEVLWVRWKERQCYLCLFPEPVAAGTAREKTGGRIAYAIFNAGDADSTAASAEFHEQSVPSGIMRLPTSSGIPLELLVDPGAFGQIRLRTRHVKECIRYPEGNCGLAIALHVWMHAQGYSSPYEQPSEASSKQQSLP